MPDLEKPPYGSPCNGCGLCCQAEVCPLGAQLFEQTDDCPALLLMGNKYVCGLAATPADFFPNVGHGDVNLVRSAVSYILGSGLGCDAQVRGEVVLHKEEIDKRMSSAYNETATHAATLVIAIALGRIL